MSDIEIIPASEMLLKIRNTESVSRKELEMILTTEDEAFVQELYRQARETAREYYGNQIYISIMNQYTPVYEQEKYRELNRRVTEREYEKVLNAALELGIENGFFQEGETARESFIPAFDYEGVGRK